MQDDCSYPGEIQRLTHWLGKLPGTGRRTAERLALALMEWPAEDVAAFGEEVQNLRSRLDHCPICGNYAHIGAICQICSDQRRDWTQLCVVETVPQMVGIEKTGCFHGLYHILGGTLSPLNGIGPEQLRMEQLRRRLSADAATPVRELILATSADVEGEATAHYIAGEFAREGLLISRLASGIPVGTKLAYADAATLTMAIQARKAMDAQNNH